MAAAYSSPVKHELVDERRSYWSTPDDIGLSHNDVNTSPDDGGNGSPLPVCLATSSGARYAVEYGDVLDLSRGCIKPMDDEDDGVLNLSSASARIDLAVDSSSDDVTTDFGIDMADTSSASLHRVSSAGSKRSLKGK